MARRRMIDPAFWMNEDLARLTPHARLLYIGLWGIADDNHATLPNRPEWIKAQVFPYELVNTPILLQELVDSGHVIVFSHDEKEYFFIPTFFNHQRVEKPSKPKYPAYPEANSGSSRGGVGEESGNTPAKVKLSKEKKSEINGKSAEAPGKKNTVSSVGDILKRGDPNKYTGKAAVNGIHTDWQEKAFRYADKLGITLGPKAKGRWLKIFKEASTNERGKAKNLEAAYRYIADYPKEMSNEQKMMFFFKIYENGVEWLQNE